MNAPRDPLAAFRPGPAQIAALALAAGVVVFYPALVELLLGHFGVRPVAGVVVAAAAATLVRRGGGLQADLPVRLPGGARVGFLLIGAVAFASDDARFLRLIPALIQLWLALLFAQSLRDPETLVERMARILQPRAPDFIAGYCRGLTVLWAALFLLNAVAIAALVFAAAPGAARTFSAYGIWLVLGGFSAVEYCVRKAHFRYYEPTGVDRIWSLLLPAQHTERGRRSLAYIDAKKAEMRAAGLTPPGEEAGAR